MEMKIRVAKHRVLFLGLGIYNTQRYAWTVEEIGSFTIARFAQS